jgi:hypothetical protein
MSILNRPSDGLYSVLIAIHRTIEYTGPIERDRLLALCGPETITDGLQVRQTLNTWLELGLFQESNGKISLDNKILTSDRTLDRLPFVVRKLLSAPENNQRFWEIDDSRAADFTRGISFLLAQDVYDFEYSSWSDAQARIALQVPADQSLFIQNDTRWSGIRAWASFLGFGHINAKGRFILEPTTAVRDALPEIFNKERTLDAFMFLTRLAEVLPVFDGGEYRLQVEERLRQTTGPSAWQPPPNGQLSTSSSRALMALISTGHLTAETASDSSGTRLILTGRNRRALENYSNLTWHPNQ